MEWQFLIFLLWHLILDRPSVGRSTPPHRMAVSQIPSLTGHISFLLWEVILGRPGVGRSTLSIKQQFHRFLLWQVIFHSYCERSCWADQVLADLHPPRNSNITDSLSARLCFIPTVRTHIGRTRCGRSNPPVEWQFHRFLLWQVIFHSYCENSYWADQV